MTEFLLLAVFVLCIAAGWIFFRSAGAFLDSHLCPEQENPAPSGFSIMIENPTMAGSLDSLSESREQVRIMTGSAKEVVNRVQKGTADLGLIFEEKRSLLFHDHMEWLIPYSHTNVICPSKDCLIEDVSEEQMMILFWKPELKNPSAGTFLKKIKTQLPL